MRSWPNIEARVVARTFSKEEFQTERDSVAITIDLFRSSCFQQGAVGGGGVAVIETEAG
jgi:hypothetical protein